MKDHVEIGHLTKYDAFRVNRDQVVDLEIWFKIFKHLNLHFRVNSLVPLFELKIVMFAHFKDYQGNHKNLKSLHDFGGCCLKLETFVWILK